MVSGGRVSGSIRQASGALHRGPGATFQSLAERFLPGVALSAVVESLCARADVAIHRAIESLSWEAFL